MGDVGGAVASGKRRYAGCPLGGAKLIRHDFPCFSGRMPEKRDVAVLSITVVDVVLSTVPSFAHHVVGTHSRQGNTGRPHSEAALLESN